MTKHTTFHPDMLCVCSVTDCPNPATHCAEIVIYAQSTRIHTPAIGYLPIGVCDAHADEEHAAALLSDAGKQQIESGFTSKGLARPDWSRSFVRWVKLKKKERSDGE